MTEQPARDDLLAAVDGSAYPLSDEECIFRSRLDGEKHVMTMDVLLAMDTCSRFRTFEDHVKSVTRRQGKLQGQEAAVRQVLDSAVGRGLFVSAREWLARGNRGAPAPAGETVPVFVRAASGGEPLRALLDSAGRLESGRGRRHRYIAVEDGDTPDARAECRRAVEAAAADSLDCHLLDGDWQRDFARRLAGDDAAVWSQLMGGAGEAASAGRVRNLVQLAAAGMPHLLLDDDRLCQARRDPSGRPGVALDADGWALWFHPDAEAARSWGEAAELDPVAEHAGVLGLSGADALRRMTREAGELAGLDFRAVGRMAEGRVLATHSGLHGVAADDSNIGHYLARGPSLERFQGDEDAYRRFRATRCLARVRDSHAFQSVVSPGPVGAAGDQVLPPTLATDGPGDGLFGALLHALYPRSRALEFPWALGRFPGAAGEMAPAWEAPFTGSLSRFLAVEVKALSQQVPELSGEARYRALAERLTALSAGSDRQLLDRVAAFQVRLRTEWIRRLNDVRRHASRPSIPWERDIKAIIRVNGQSLEGGVPRRVAGMPERLDDAAAAAWLRERIDPLARSLAVWPALWRAAWAEQPLKSLGLTP